MPQVSERKGLSAMVFAAGFGTRLRPLTEALPKPAVPVANRPLAIFTLEHLMRSGVTDVVLNTHHLARELRAALEPQMPEGLTARFAHEPQILGTGGGLRSAWKPEAGEAFIVANGDILFAPDLARALSLHRATGAIATMVLRGVADPDRFGSVEIEPFPGSAQAGEAPAAGRVRRLLGQPADREGPWHKRMFTGVHVFDARAWQDLPEEGCIIRHSYRRWIDRGETVAAVVDDSPWFDLGTPRAYLEANLALAAPEARSVVKHPTADVHPAADVESCVLGEGAAITGPAVLREVVAWPAARITASDARAIYLGDGRRVACT
jgi:mannose-1-phosphate guanylyltransferase